MHSKTDFLTPLVSIVITSFNRGHLIEKAIQSAIDQDYENLEFVNKDLPHQTIDKLITFFEKTEEYEKCFTLQKIKHTRLSEYTKYNL